MSQQMLYRQVIGTILCTLLLVGCGAPAATPTPIQPTATSTPVPPTKIPPTQTRPARVPNVEMIFGNWQPLSGSRDAMFLQINSDDTCYQSSSLDRLGATPEVECTYTFEDSVLSMTVVKLNGVPECPTPTGSYEVRMITEDQIQLVVTLDSCGPRKNSTAGSYQRIP